MEIESFIFVGRRAVCPDCQSTALLLSTLIVLAANIVLNELGPGLVRSQCLRRASALVDEHSERELSDHNVVEAIIGAVL